MLGDQKHRAVRYSVTAATRFREYFLGIPGGRPTLCGRGRADGARPQRQPPRSPPVHSIVPIYNWDRDLLAGQYQHARTSGLRVYLRRPWGPTGTDERLGVVVYDSGQRRGEPGAQRPVCRLISATLDPLEDEANVAPPPPGDELPGQEGSAEPHGPAGAGAQPGAVQLRRDRGGAR